jgi:hypothetical protein
MHQTKLVRSVKDDHFLLIKATIHQEDITIVNIYTLNVGTPNFIKQMLQNRKAKINPNTIIVGYLRYPTIIKKKVIQIKKKKSTRELQNYYIMDQMDLADIYRIFHLRTGEYTFFSAAHGTFLKTDRILGHKARLNKQKKIEITSFE